MLSTYFVRVFVVYLRIHSSFRSALWFLQAFYLKTYVGTELEHPCMACVVKPPDDVCNACDFDLDDDNISDQTIGFTNISGSISDDQVPRRSAAAGSSSSSSSADLSEECQACVVSLHVCVTAEGVDGVRIEFCQRWLATRWL